jgi:hypothetical protein
MLAGLFVMLGMAAVSSKKKAAKAESAKEGEDILSELGYEFEAEKPKPEGSKEDSSPEDLAKELGKL